MRQNNELIDYESQNKLDKDQKRLLVFTISIFLLFTIISLVLEILIDSVTHLLIGYVIGSISSTALFIITYKFINQSYFRDYQKITKRIHIIYQVTYFLVLLGVALIFKDFFVIIGLTLGLLLIRMSIILANITKKK